MPYTIPFSDPSKSSSPITVNDNTENITSTSLSLVGRNYSNYGVAFAKNFVHLLENFASPSSPGNSIEGQLWYNNITKRLYINDSTGGTSNWRPAGGTHVAPSTNIPQNPLLGDLWVDTLTQQLSLYNGSNWVLVGPTALSGKKTGSYVEQLEDSSGVKHLVSIVTIAESLNVTSPSVATVSANNFARRDSANQFYGQQSILNDAGLNIGSTSGFSLSVLQGTSVIKNTSDGGSIDFIISNQGSQNIVMKLDGRNQRVGINHPTPQVELDVNGDAFISGHLTMTGTIDSSSPTSGSFQSRGGAGIAKNLYVGKNIVSKGSLQIGEVNDSNVPVAGSAIIPNASSTYDIGTSSSKFRTVYADNFSGNFTGNFQGQFDGQVQGSAARLTNSTNFTLTGDVNTISAKSFNGTQVSLELTNVLSDSSITGKTEVVDSRIDDTLLIYRSNLGLRKVTRTNFLLGEAFVPIGSIFPFAGTQIPLGYLLCDGALVSRVEYPTLYQAIGSTYGASAGGEYFRLPDLRGRFPLGNAAMANSLSNVIVNKAVTLPNATPSTTVNLSNTENIYIGMVVTGSGNVPSNTVVIDTTAETVTLNNAVTIASGSVLTFTIRVLRDTIPVNSSDRVSSVTGDNSASEIGGSGGLSKRALNTQTSGTAPIYTSAGSAQNFNTTFDIGLTNPYLTINYIIRVGVGATQLG